MASGTEAKSSAVGVVRRHSDAPLPDLVPGASIRTSRFKADARRQSLAVTKSVLASEDQSFIDAFSDPACMERNSWAGPPSKADF